MLVASLAGRVADPLEVALFGSHADASRASQVISEVRSIRSARGASGSSGGFVRARGPLLMSHLQRLMGLLAFSTPMLASDAMPDAAQLMAPSRWLLLDKLLQREVALAAGLDSSSRLRQAVHAGIMALKPPVEPHTAQRDGLSALMASAPRIQPTRSQLVCAVSRKPIGDGPGMQPGPALILPSGVVVASSALEGIRVDGGEGEG